MKSIMVGTGLIVLGTVGYLLIGVALAGIG